MIVAGFDPGSAQSAAVIADTRGTWRARAHAHFTGRPVKPALVLARTWEVGSRVPLPKPKIRQTTIKGVDGAPDTVRESTTTHHRPHTWEAVDACAAAVLAELRAHGAERLVIEWSQGVYCGDDASVWEAREIGTHLLRAHGVLTTLRALAIMSGIDVVMVTERVARTRVLWCAGVKSRGKIGRGADVLEPVIADALTGWRDRVRETGGAGPEHERSAAVALLSAVMRGPEAEVGKVARVRAPSGGGSRRPRGTRVAGEVATPKVPRAKRAPPVTVAYPPKPERRACGCPWQGRQAKVCRADHFAENRTYGIR